MAWALLLGAALSGGMVPQSNGPQHWFAPASEKVYPDSRRPDAPYPGRVSLALGEYEALQLVLRSEEDLQDLRVAAVPTWQQRDGWLRLRPEWIELFEVRYVPTPADKSHARTPDPLVPLTQRDGVARISLKGGETKALWIRLRAPDDARPGAYEVSVLVGDFWLAGGVLRTLEGPFIAAPLQVTVWPFRLPRHSHVRTAFGISGGYIAKQHAVPAGGDEERELYRRYYDELLAHRICAYSVPYAVDDPRAEPYLRDERVNSFTVAYSDDEATLARTWQRLQAMGVAHKAWAYPLDEPVNREQYDSLKARAARVHGAAPGLKVCSPFFRSPDWDDKLTPFDELVDYLDIWCCNTGYYSRPDVQRLMRERQEAGEEAWWYVCCGPGHPFPNLFVTMSALQHRLLPWQMYHYGITGLLYWSTTYWNPSITANPYEDIATVKDINPSLYGDGSLFYPGKQVGIDGPVTSVRLECLRDGLEDYEYLMLARRVLGEQAVAEIVDQVSPELLRYVAEPAEFERVRQELGEKLTAAKG